MYLNLRDGKATTLSQLLSKSEQREDAKGADHHTSRQQAYSTIDANTLKHGPSEENSSKSKRASAKTVRAEDTRCVTRIDEGDIKQDALGDEVYTKDRETKANGGYNPMNRRS